jgi:FkbM family methyltransferase
MKAKIYGFFRDKFHPLHRLRKSKFFRERMLPLLDKDIAVQGDFVRKIYVKAITHSSFYMSSGALEPRIKILFMALLEKIPAESLFFDIGANIGLYTWLAAGVRDDLKIISFEPDPENFRLLTKTANAWHSPNVRLYQTGLSSECGDALFRRDIITSATGSLEQNESFAETHFQTTGESIQVSITTINAMALKEGMPAIIKIDVEGHEPKVFAGAWDTIQKVKPLIFFEFYSSDSVIVSKLTEYGYVLFDADHGGFYSERTVNFVAVQSGSPLEAIVRAHLLSDFAHK